MTRPAQHRFAVHLDDRAAEACGVLSQERVLLVPECRRRLRSGAWRSYAGVVVTHNGPLTPEQADWVAVLVAGEGAVLGAVSAMRAAGVRVEPPERPQVVVPALRRAPRSSVFDCRRSRLLGATEVHPLRQPPAFRTARATLDATSLLRRPDAVRALLCAPVQQRLVRVPDLRRALDRLGPHPGRGLLLRTLDALETGAQTAHEQEFRRLVHTGGLPAPDHQVLRSTPSGRRFLDADWDEYRVHVEIDGLAHMWVEQWVADLERSNELEICRWERRLRFPGHRLTEDPDGVLDQLRRALRAGGWRR